ncbi:hypothetical protein E3T35_08680 [Cryobacterium sp. TMT1-2-2]|uniref:hypothetical protein n=1 Tax=Cryobacterium sp. TMT1-2-2 TaxID=1259233 RepID=UPI00106D2821|nr:hypothetical protein [Cryobacterium sp. TMT1-2-2]TFD11852.1 hypothetical protein E3T35_08680 [Cryobacterium sp. TMT1-2-2]
MSIGILLVLAALYLVLMRRFILRRRRIAAGLPVSGPWHFPAWLRRRLPRWLRRRFTEGGFAGRFARRPRWPRRSRSARKPRGTRPGPP